MAGIADVAKQAGVKEADVKAVFQAIRTLAADERVSIKSFGSFQFKETAARAGRNPKTGAAIQIPAKMSLKFSASKG